MTSIVGRRQRRESPPALTSPGHAGWFGYLLWLLLFGYWLFALGLERVDLSQWLAGYWPLFSPPPAALVFVVELFHPRVLRHVIPVFIGWQLARSAAVSLVQTLYDLPDKKAGAQFLDRLRSTGDAPGKQVTLNDQTLEEDREKHVLLRVGGPGKVGLSSSSTAVTELNGRFHRVLGKGSHRLGRLEYVRAVLDLREQERSATDVTVRTRDGIELTADIHITYRISTGGATPTREQPFPFDEDAVRTAAYAETVAADGRVTTWDSWPIRVARGRLARIISQFNLDELLLHPNPTRNPWRTVQNNLSQEVDRILGGRGIELIGVHLTRLDLPEAVKDQYLDFWRTHWQRRDRQSLAQGKAFKLEEMEIARAEAEVTMIQAIVEGVQRARQSGNAGDIRQIVALRLIESLEQMAKQSQQAHPLPIGLMPRLGSLRQQIVLPDADRKAE